MRTVTVAGAALALAIAAAISTQAQTPSVPPQRIAPEQLASQHEATLAGLADPLQRAAYKVVVMQHPQDVPAWKLALYADALATGRTIDGRAKTTTYCPRCSGRTCADGSRVRNGICAAPRCVPIHSIIWTANRGLLLVTDRGGAVQSAPSRYLRRGESIVVDAWVPRCQGGCWTGPGTQRRVAYAVLRSGRQQVSRLATDYRRRRPVVTTTAAATVASTGNPLLELLDKINADGDPMVHGRKRARKVVRSLQRLELVRMERSSTGGLRLTPAGRDILRLAGGAQ